MAKFVTPATPVPFHLFKNGVCVVNTTPHSLTMQEFTGELVSVPSSPDYLVNAQVVEAQTEDPLFVTPTYKGTDKGGALIAHIEDWFQLHVDEGAFPEDSVLVIVGSAIAMQAYKGKIAGLCPVPEYERVAPAEKRMRCDKFSIVEEG